MLTHGLCLIVQSAWCEGLEEIGDAFALWDGMCNGNFEDGYSYGYGGGSGDDDSGDSGDGDDDSGDGDDSGDSGDSGCNGSGNDDDNDDGDDNNGSKDSVMVMTLMLRCNTTRMFSNWYSRHSKVFELSALHNTMCVLLCSIVHSLQSIGGCRVTWDV